jgi:ribosome-binding protein aMBF1 (putative translation factor)
MVIMKKKLPPHITFEELEKEWMNDPEFVKEWKKIEPEYEIARQIIGARLAKNMTQSQLAEKLGTGQAVISRLEGGNAKPSISLLRRVAVALDTEIKLVIR